MQLHFLGAEYTCQWPSIETREGEIVGKYRGVAWSAKHQSPTIASGQPMTLQFMGRSYQAQV